ncbi:MAG: sporulation transcriptional regulator SpoIIID [Clostridia bacterium]|nr:sporulation transcriptional regulator SpoIIID [Clostridia bacterium]
MKEYIIRRVIDVSNYIIDTGSTVRETAKLFKISKSTVHKDCTERLSVVDRHLYKQVKKILNINLAERHLRGGEATRKKYLKKRKIVSV